MGERTRRAAEALADQPLQIIDQVDTFFVCTKGRLKLRELSPTHGELIAYEREDIAGTKASSYVISRTPEPQLLHAVLAHALDVRGTVKKRRHLFLHGQTRIHLDEVEGLGKFLELEVVMNPGRAVAGGEQIARDLMEKLGVREEDLVAGGYLDLIRGG